MNAATCQHTLKNVIRARGVALHSGEPVHLTLRPAPPDHGIVFLRTDCSPAVRLPAHVDCVGGTRLATTLTDGRVQVSTVEHLMAAFAGLGIDNALVEVTAGELPIMDGSASPFVFLLQCAGVDVQAAPKSFLRVRKPVCFADGHAHAGLFPYDGFRVEYTLEYDHPAFDPAYSSAAIDVNPSRFARDIARARTFGFLADRERLDGMSLGRGGSLDNVVVLDECGVLNQQGLRLGDEFVKHKILDVIGDLYLAGHALIGEFRGYRSGHTINAGLVRALLADPDAFEIVTFDSAADLPGAHARAIPEIA